MPTVALAGSPNNPKFSVIDFSNPGSPLAVSPSFQDACQVKQDGANAYIGNLLGGQVQLFDISNPAVPVAHGTAPTVLAGIGAITVRGTRVAVGEATNTFKARICLIDFSSPGAPEVLGTASTPLVSSVDPGTGNTLAAISSLAFIGPNLVVASGPANFVIAIADFTNPATPTVTTFTAPAPPCLDADENVQHIVTGDTTASWVRLYDTSWNLKATANSTLNSVDYLSLSGLLALAGSNNTFQVALIDFSTISPTVTVFDPQMGGGSCTSIKGTLGCCGAVLGQNVKLFNLTTNPPALLATANTTLGSIGSLDMGTIAPVFTASPTSLVFGTVRAGTKASQTLTISNMGNAPLSITAIQSSSPNFTPKQSSLTISPGANSSLIVTFAPNAEAAFTGNLTMQTTDPTHTTVTIPLSGTGALPHMSVSPTSLNVSGYAACQSGTASLTIQNTGGLNLTVNALSTGGAPFAVASANPLIPPGGSFPVPVTFTPTAVGMVNGNLVINSDDPTNSLFTVALHGNGLPAPPPSLTVDTLNLNVGEVVVGTMSRTPFGVTNSSPCQELNLGATASGQPFLVGVGNSAPPVPQPQKGVNVNVSSGHSFPLTIYFSPAVVGPQSGTLDIVSNPNIVVALTGTGTAPPKNSKDTKDNKENKDGKDRKDQKESREKTRDTFDPAPPNAPDQKLTAGSGPEATGEAFITPTQRPSVGDQALGEEGKG